MAARASSLISRACSIVRTVRVSDSRPAEEGRNGAEREPTFRKFGPFDFRRSPRSVDSADDGHAPVSGRLKAFGPDQSCRPPPARGSFARKSRERVEVNGGKRR